MKKLKNQSRRHFLRGAARIVEVSDAEVEGAMVSIFTDTHNAAEGAGAAGLAALLQEPEANRGRTVGFVLTGANVDAARFAGVLSKAARQR